jgi:hypothetical protein
MFAKTTIKILCAAGLMLLAACDEDKPKAEKKGSGNRAEIALTLTDFRYAFENDRHTFFHSRNYVESGNVGVTFNRGKVCVEGGKICVESAVQYRIEPGATLTQPDHKVATKLEKDEITIEYWGSADNGEPVYVRRVVRTDGQTAKVQ